LCAKGTILDVCYDVGAHQWSTNSLSPGLLNDELSEWKQILICIPVLALGQELLWRRNFSALNPIQTSSLSFQ
jgi:hypothetical protein